MTGGGEARSASPVARVLFALRAERSEHITAARCFAHSAGAPSLRPFALLDRFTPPVRMALALGRGRVKYRGAAAMKCQKCAKQATLHITEVISDEQFEELHLCEE